MTKWLDVHPLKEIPNSKDAPLFVTKGPAIDDVLDWSRAHPGKPVPKRLLEKTRMSSEEIGLEMLSMMVDVKLHKSRPDILWVYVRTGFFVGPRGFQAMRLENRREYLAAFDEWESLPKSARQEFVKLIGRRVAAWAVSEARERKQINGKPRPRKKQA